MPLKASAAYVGASAFETLIETDRQLIRRLFGSRPGFIEPSDFLVTPGTGLAVNISPGGYVLRHRENNSQGFYFAWSDDPETLPWPTASTEPRIDTLLLRVADPQYGTVSGAVGARWDILQGTPAATPLTIDDATINSTYRVPGAWERVVDVLVPAGATSFVPGNIGHRDRKTALTGALLPVPNAAARPTVGLYDGYQIWRSDIDVIEVYNGSAWVQQTPPRAVPADAGDYNFGDTTSTTYVTLLSGGSANPLSASIIAPPSGKVLVAYNSFCVAGAGTNAGRVLAVTGLRLNGPGFANVDPGDRESVVFERNGTVTLGARISATWTQGGLTPGSSYTWTSVMKVAGAVTGQFAGFDSRAIELIPLP